MSILNYGELKSAVADWLDRTDLTARIPDFITLAEVAIFRDLRCPGNEVTALYNADDFDNTQFIQLPGDFLETKLITYGGKPLTAISSAKYSALMHHGTLPEPSGPPEAFCRIAGELYFYPPASTNSNVVLYYYQTQGPLVDDADYTRALTFAPDLYVFGSLLQAQAYLIGDERLSVWGSQYQVAMNSLNEQVDDEAYAGSVVSINNVYEM